MREFPRTLYEPPGARPRWIKAETAPYGLQYLSWGWRDYDKHAIPISRHSGWIYHFVDRAGVIMHLAKEKAAIAPGSMVVLGPDCANGWSATAGTRCEIRTWIWSDAPTVPGLRLSADSWRVFRLGPDAANAMEALHAESRLEVRSPDEATPLALHAIRLRLDILLSRLPAKTRRSPKNQLRNALDWLAKHPGEFSPADTLSDYLKISPASLNRMFRAEFGKSVKEVAVGMRLEAARSLLASPDSTIKEIAYRLGYVHPNDFTRAYRNYWGYAPTRHKS